MGLWMGMANGLEMMAQHSVTMAMAMVCVGEMLMAVPERGVRVMVCV